MDGGRSSIIKGSNNLVWASKASHKNALEMALQRVKKMKANNNWVKVTTTFLALNRGSKGLQVDMLTWTY